MATASYTFNKDINSLQLIQELDSAVGVIGQSVSHINKSNGNVMVHYQNVLSSTEESHLNQIVSSHVPDLDFADSQLKVTPEDLSRQVIDMIETSGGFPYYQYQESPWVNISTSTYWQNKLSFTTDELSPALYKVEWAYMWNANYTSSDIEVEVYIQNSVDGVATVFKHQQEAADSGGDFGSTGSNQRHSVSNFITLPLQGVQTLVMKYRSNESGKQVSIWDAKIDIQKVGDGSISQYDPGEYFEDWDWWE